MDILRKPKIVVLGMMSRHPVAGVVWQTVHYLIGLERLGFDVYYVEAHGLAPTKMMRSEADDCSALAVDLIGRVMDRFGFAGRWAFHARHDDGRCYGMEYARLLELYRSAAVIINLHGATIPLPEHAATGRLVFLETDPVKLQIELHDGVPEAIEFLRPHCAFFSFGENYGRPGCGLPVSPEFDFRPTRQPVVTDFWDAARVIPRDCFTTVGNWRQVGRDVVYRGESYGWSKHDEFVKFLDLPGRTGRAFELCMAKCDPPDEELLGRHGWRVKPSGAISYDLDDYRGYIGSSVGEFTVAKDQNVRLRSGWFSDRSACYLAAGRPVVTQDTGFGDVLPTGEGLFGFSTPEEAADAVGRIGADYARHSRAAGDIAREHFAAEVVLGKLLDEVGVPLPGRATGQVSRAVPEVALT